MIRWLVTLAPALVAAGVGVFAQTADSPDSYVSALRVMFHAALVMTWISVVFYVWRKQDSIWKRLGLSVLLLASLRVLYVPLVDLGLLGAAWSEQLAVRAGLADRGLLVHAALGFWIVLIAGPLCMLVVAAVTRPFLLASKLLILVLVLFAVVAFLSPEDRKPWPHDFRKAELAGRTAPLDAPPGSEGSRFGDAISRRGERVSTRIVALGSAALELAMPKSGWGGALMDALSERHAEQPPESQRMHVEDLEYAFVEARPLLEGK